MAKRADDRRDDFVFDKATDKDYIKSYISGSIQLVHPDHHTFKELMSNT